MYQCKIPPLFVSYDTRWAPVSVPSSTLLYFSYARSLLHWHNVLPLINGQVLPAPVLVDPRVKVQLPHA